MNGICLCIDRLHAGFLGTCGSTWVHTPALDQMAADGFVFDQFHVDSLEVESLYRSHWFGRHALEPATTSPSGSQSLAALLRGHGIRTLLAMDNADIAALPGAEGFDEQIPLPQPVNRQSASSVEATHLGRAFAQVVQRIASIRSPFFLWCHLSSLGWVWDAPWEMRSQCAEADDPDPPTGIEVPCRWMEEGEDPDLLLGISQAYAGQISLLDLCVGAVCDALADARLDQETAVALVGLRGLALGEHGCIGPTEDRLDGELVHVPLVIRLPDPARIAGRSQELVQPPDLYSTWLGLLAHAAPPARYAACDLSSVVYGDATLGRDRIGLAGREGRRGLRTSAWYLKMGSVPELFAKPDDRWEVNDVADRHRDVAEELAAVLGEYQSSLSTAQLGGLSPLSEVLRSGLS